MSDSQSGANNSMYGRTGANHPKFGITPTNAMTINVYSIPEVLLIGTFSSQVACAKWLEVSNITVSRYIRSGKILQGKYLLTSSPI